MCMFGMTALINVCLALDDNIQLAVLNMLRLKYRLGHKVIQISKISILEKIKYSY